MAVLELGVHGSLPGSEVWRLCCSGRSPNQSVSVRNVIMVGLVVPFCSEMEDHFQVEELDLLIASSTETRKLENWRRRSVGSDVRS